MDFGVGIEILGQFEHGALLCPKLDFLDRPEKGNIKVIEDKVLEKERGLF
jgi:hypothetical protein